MVAEEFSEAAKMPSSLREARSAAERRKGGAAGKARALRQQARGVATVAMEHLVLIEFMCLATPADVRTELFPPNWRCGLTIKPRPGQQGPPLTGRPTLV